MPTFEITFSYWENSELLLDILHAVQPRTSIVQTLDYPNQRSYSVKIQKREYTHGGRRTLLHSCHLCKQWLALVHASGSVNLENYQHGKCGLGVVNGTNS